MYAIFKEHTSILRHSKNIKINENAYRSTNRRNKTFKFGGNTENMEEEKRIKKGL